MTNQINNQSIIRSTDVIQLTLTLKMTTAQVVETSVTVNNNSPIQDYVHPDDQTVNLLLKWLLDSNLSQYTFSRIFNHIACYEKKGTIPGFTRIRKNKGLQKSLKTVDLCTYQCKAGGGGGWGRQGMGWGFDCLCWPWGRAFDWCCSPRGWEIWIFLRPTWRYLATDLGEKDCDGTSVSHFLASRMRRTVWKIRKSWRPMRTSEGWVNSTVLSSNFVCFSVFLINWTS